MPRSCRWTWCMRTLTSSSSTRPAAWWSIPRRDIRTGLWSTPCSITAGTRSPASAACSAPASSTASTRTPRVCWSRRRTISATPASPRSSRITACSASTRPWPAAPSARTRGRWTARSAAARATASAWRSLRKTASAAVTHWQVLARYRGYCLLRCRLETGRTHQIRVHMASIGHPLLGDGLYGAKCPDKGLEGQCLHARRLQLIHPRSGEQMLFEAPLPDYFMEVLSRLGPEQ